MRMRGWSFPLLTALVLLSSVRTAYANVLGSDTQHFNATTDGLDFVTVHSSETLLPGIINLGFFMNYAVNTLPFLTETEKSRQLKVRDSLLAADFNFGLGIVRNVDVGLSFPFIVKQIVNSSADRGEFSKSGNTEIRGNVKWRLYGNNEGGVAFVFSANYDRVQDNPYAGLNAGLTTNYELVFDTSFAGFAAGLNVGYRDRNPGDQVPEFAGRIAPLDDQYIYSAALSYHLQAINTKVIYEIFASQPADKESGQNIERKTASSENLIGIKHDISDNIALHAGVGSELAHAISTPDYRVYVGVNATFGHPAPAKKKLVKQKIKAKVPAPEIPADDTPEIPAEGGPGDEVFVLRDVNFLFDSESKVLAGAKVEMSKLASRIKEVGYSKIIIEGHTDSMGSDEYNMKLAQRRANSIKDFLVREHAMDASKIEAVSFGEHKPIASNANYQGRQLNRRVVFRIFY